MKENKLNHLLLDRFPELIEKFNEETSWQEGYDTGSTVVFEDVFMPYVLEMLERDNRPKLKQIFEFIEEMANSSDNYENNVIRLAVIDNFKYYDRKLGYEKYFLNKTRELYKQ